MLSTIVVVRVDLIHNVEDYSVVAGVSARKIADCPRNFADTFNWKHRHFI